MKIEIVDHIRSFYVIVRMCDRCVLCVPNTTAAVALSSDDNNDGVSILQKRRRRRPVVEPATSYVMTTRFNEETWNQHRAFMEKITPSIQACYCSPMGISSHIEVAKLPETVAKLPETVAKLPETVAKLPETVAKPTLAPTNIKLFVLEMHNGLNKIMGIGAVFARSHYRKYAMYSDDKYNVCAFVGPYRIDRADMNAEEEAVLVMLDALCFRGKRHLKRLRGLTLFPADVLGHCRESHEIDFRASIQAMFRRRFTTGR